MHHLAVFTHQAHECVAVFLLLSTLVSLLSIGNHAHSRIVRHDCNWRLLLRFAWRYWRVVLWNGSVAKVGSRSSVNKAISKDRYLANTSRFLLARYLSTRYVLTSNVNEKLRIPSFFGVLVLNWACRWGFYTEQHASKQYKQEHVTGSASGSTSFRLLPEGWAVSSPFPKIPTPRTLSARVVINPPSSLLVWLSSHPLILQPLAQL